LKGVAASYTGVQVLPLVRHEEGVVLRGTDPSLNDRARCMTLRRGGTSGG
jgi:hypothetical protein